MKKLTAILTTCMLIVFVSCDLHSDLNIFNSTEGQIDHNNLWFKGIQHVPIGEAKLRIENSKMIISNLGESLEDADYIKFPNRSLNDTLEWGLSFDDPFLLKRVIPNNAKRIITYKDKDNNSICTFSLNKEGEIRNLEYLFNNPSKIGVEFYNSGELIEKINSLEAMSVKMDASDLNIEACLEVCCDTRWFSWCIKICTGSNLRAKINGAHEVFGFDEYKIISEPFNPSSLQIATINIPEIILNDFYILK